MIWQTYATVVGHKILYKEVDIGLTMELISDLKNNGIELSDSKIENMYNQAIQVIRDKKINEILN